MKKFDLERALAGDPVITRDGRKVLQLVYFSMAEKESKILALLEIGGSPASFFKDGKYIAGEEHDVDLFMAHKTKKLWIAISKEADEKNHRKCSHAFSSIEECKRYGFREGHHYVEVEIEE